MALSNHVNKLDHVYEFGSHLCTIGEWAFKATTQPEGATARSFFLAVAIPGKSA